VTKEKILLGSLASVQPPETTVYAESDRTDRQELKGSILSSMTVSQGLHRESVIFNRLSMLDQEHIKAPRG